MLTVSPVPIIIHFHYGEFWTHNLIIQARSHHLHLLLILVLHLHPYESTSRYRNSLVIDVDFPPSLALHPRFLSIIGDLVTSLKLPPASCTWSELTVQKIDWWTTQPLPVPGCLPSPCSASPKSRFLGVLHPASTLMPNMGRVICNWWSGVKVYNWWWKSIQTLV